MNRNTNKIKYDQKDYKALQISCIVSVMILTLAILLLFAEVPGSELIMVLALYIGGGLGIVSAIRCFCARMYLSRLKACGYEIPANKKEYEGILEKLPRYTVQKTDEDQQSTNDIDIATFGMKRSRSFAIASFAVWSCLAAYNVIFLVSWSFYGTAEAAVFMLFIWDTVWLIMALVYWLQSNPNKYKEDVVIDPSKRNRTTLEAAIIYVLFFFALTCIANSSLKSMTRYIYASNLEGTRSLLADIGYNMQSVYDEQIINGHDAWDETYAQLESGIVINEWGSPDDIFQKEVANRMDISDYRELDSRFKIAKGAAQIYCIKDADGQIHAYLQNPIIKVTPEKLDGILVPE